MSDFFTLKRGCRQGDPISPYLFLLCAEVLGQMIRREDNIKGIKINGTELKISQYADDTQLFLDGTEESLRKTLNILHTFYNMSGLKINVEKTKAIWIGPLSHSEKQICGDFKLDWSQGPFKILGVTFTTELFDIWNINAPEILNKLKNILHQWSKRKLTLMGRIIIIKTLALSKFVHLFLALPNPPGELIKTLEKIIYKFLWNSGPDRISRRVMVKNISAGGLRMVHLISFIKALKVSWLRRVIHSETANWCAFAFINFSKVISTGPVYAINQRNALNNPFWKDILDAWADFCKIYKAENIQFILYSPVWYNSNFKNSQNLYINDWFKKGVKNICDLLNENGEFYQFEEFKQIYGIRGTILDYEYVLRKIPDQWKIILENNKVFYIQNRFNVVRSPYIACLLKDKKGSRVFYDIFTMVEDINKHNKWENELGHINERDWNIYHSVVTDIDEIKLRDFQYKINNKILVTKSFLFKINKIDNDLCSYCKQYPESIAHLFLRCEKVKEFWGSLRTWLKHNCNIDLNLEDRNIIFSHQYRNSVENYLLVLGKYYIYKNKFSENNLNRQAFMSLLKKKFDSGKYIALIHDKLGKFVRKWSRLYNHFMQIY